MILLDKPYISDFLIDTIRNDKYQVIETNMSSQLILDQKLKMVSEHDAIEHVKSKPNTLIYTNSENSLGWIEKNLTFIDLPNKIGLFKNKFAFRELIKCDYPNYFYKKVEINELDKIKIDDFPFPFIIKPATGFFSLGVHKVGNLTEWNTIKNKIKMEVELVKELFPKEVVNTEELIIEECIMGEEFAIDCYFNHKGKPVILNILKHIFGSDKDVSDRVYITTKEIIESYHPQLEKFLERIGTLADLKNFPCHVEIRIDDTGKINPIEVNPLRFGGLCTTADLTWHAYGFNSYEYFFNQQQPDWNKLLKKKGNLIYSLIVLDNSSGIEAEKIVSFNYDKVLSMFEKPLELRKFDYLEYPLFGYMFCETRSENFQELMQILKSDLSEYVVT